MDDTNVNKTKRFNLCVSCELCLGVCPTSAISTEQKFGQILPIIDEIKCIKCGLCLKLCPGIDILEKEAIKKTDEDDMLLGNYHDIYTAHSKNISIRKNSTSGGMITALVSKLIENKDYDGAFVLDIDNLHNNEARLKLKKNTDEIFKTSKSKYIPGSIYHIIKVIKNIQNKKIIIVGTPCQLKAVKKLLKNSKKTEKNFLFLGLFCDKTMNFNAIRYFEDKYKKENEKLVKLDYRNKEKSGWPGDLKLYFNSGRTITINRKKRSEIKKYFQLNRCLFCYDKLNKSADISFGDCYIPEKKSEIGKSNILIRTKKGQRYFKKYAYLFTYEKESIMNIVKSQEMKKKLENFEFAKIFAKIHNLRSDTSEIHYKSDKLRNLLNQQKYIKWGMNYNLNRIKFDIIASRIQRKFRKVTTILSTVVQFAANDLSKIINHSKRRPNNKTNILVIGGNFFNKGAQAMTFSLIDQLKRRFPDKKIFLMSTIDFKRSEKEKKRYTFNILPSITRGYISDFFFYKKQNLKLEKIVSNSCFFIDISGYALSSQLKTESSIKYLLNIKLAKTYNIPYYIFPQSIGPFKYPIFTKIFLYPLIFHYLKYPKKIFARENEGLKFISKITKNAEKQFDIVLQNGEYNQNCIFIKNTKPRRINIEQNSVAIIPNYNLTTNLPTDDIYSIYNRIIKTLLNKNRKIYILRHSYNDLDLCEKLKSQYENDNRINIISEDLNVFEIENVLRQFEFIIASRYHSIIHAYKKGVPCLVIGWATKYFELLEIFNQLDFLFDIRKKIDHNSIKYAVEKMINNHGNESKKIFKKIEEIQNENRILDVLNGCY
jgi:coenzyme F420-reducing hydrogenase beta subunit/polysaccharide pyruvyl transferase WcaK-like protein